MRLCIGFQLDFRGMQATYKSAADIHTYVVYILYICVCMLGIYMRLIVVKQQELQELQNHLNHLPSHTHRQICHARIRHLMRISIGEHRVTAL